MRVNVYASELPQGVERVTKDVEVESGGVAAMKTLVGLRFRTDEDDPESAVTFWANSAADLRVMLLRGLDALIQRAPDAQPSDRGYGE